MALTESAPSNCSVASEPIPADRLLKRISFQATPRLATCMALCAEVAARVSLPACSGSGDLALGWEFFLLRKPATSLRLVFSIARSTIRLASGDSVLCWYGWFIIPIRIARSWAASYQNDIIGSTAGMLEMSKTGVLELHGSPKTRAINPPARTPAWPCCCRQSTPAACRRPARAR
ncbi:hypothetical protein D3C79_810280 [compost metagenome]